MEFIDRLFYSDDPGEWEAAQPRVYTQVEMIAYLEQLRAASFQRLRWMNPPSHGAVDLQNDNPWSTLPAACPPKQGGQNPNMNRHSLLALDVRATDASGKWQVSPGFLRWSDRWYFSPDANQFAPTVSSCTLWKQRATE